MNVVLVFFSCKDRNKSIRYKINKYGTIKENTQFIQILVKSYLDTSNRYMELANTIMNYKGVDAHSHVIEMQNVLGKHAKKDNSSFLTLKDFKQDKWDTIVARLIDAI